MTIANIEEKLNELKEVEKEIAEYTAKSKQEIANVIPEEIVRRIEWLEKQLADFLAPISLLREQLEKEIGASVLKNKLSIKSSGGYQAIFVKGRVTWDSKALTGYALAHPEIEKLCKVGKPSVRIRKK